MRKGSGDPKKAPPPPCSKNYHQWANVGAYRRTCRRCGARQVLVWEPWSRKQRPERPPYIEPAELYREMRVEQIDDES